MGNMAFFDARRRDPEARLLNMRELAVIRDAHVADYNHVAGEWTAVCACGRAFLVSEHLMTVREDVIAHVADVIEFAKGRKCAEARANAAIDAALVAGLGGGAL